MSILNRQKSTRSAGAEYGQQLRESDKNLVKLAAKGDTEAFGELVDRYWDKITALVYQKLGRFPEVEDVVQETFIKAYDCLEQLRKPGNFAAWLYQIASKLCIDQLRRKHRRNVSLDEMREKDRQFKAVENEVTASGLFDYVLEAVGSLPEKYRIVVTLRFMQGMSCNEIASHLGMPAGTVRNRLFRANAILKEKLVKALEEYKFPAVEKPGSNEAEDETERSGS